MPVARKNESGQDHMEDIDFKKIKNTNLRQCMKWIAGLEPTAPELPIDVLEYDRAQIKMTKIRRFRACGSIPSAWIELIIRRCKLSKTRHLLYFHIKHSDFLKRFVLRRCDGMKFSHLVHFGEGKRLGGEQGSFKSLLRIVGFMQTKYLISSKNYKDESAISDHCQSIETFNGFNDDPDMRLRRLDSCEIKWGQTLKSYWYSCEERGPAVQTSLDLRE
jgi:hypothetical protein